MNSFSKENVILGIFENLVKTMLGLGCEVTCECKLARKNLYSNLFYNISSCVFLAKRAKMLMCKCSLCYHKKNIELVGHFRT